MPEIFEKWGFGMAPPKPDIQAQREGRARVVLDLIASAEPPPWPQSELDAISEVKGLFKRAFRMDQWDWFTVSSQLGHPGRALAKRIGEGLEELRSAARDGDETGLRRAQKGLCESPARKCLRAFLGKLEIPDEPNAGWVYILSTRREPDLLKIGMTTRTVEESVREINGSTGVAVPYGVRRCWRVSGPARAEKLVHDALKDERVRSDREFFRIDFMEAERRIMDALREFGIELRTLHCLAALASDSG